MPAFYCDGRDFDKAVVPGRLGGINPTAFRNPFGEGSRCDQKCVAADSPNTGDGFKSCFGYTRPITVWRGSSYRPDFDTNAKYKLINAQSRKAVDLYGFNTAEGGAVVQWDYLSGPNQLYRIVLVASSTWKLVSVHSGKVLTGMGSSSGTAITQKSYVDCNSHEWSIDDHNGHFKIRNKDSQNVLQVAAGNASNGAAIQTGPWAGTLNQDWDIVIVP